MTKNESIEAGRIAGSKTFDSMLVTAETLKTWKADESLDHTIGTFASYFMAERKIRSNVFYVEFVRAFRGRVNAAYNELPEVKAAFVVRMFERKLESIETTAKSEIARFAKKLEADAFHALDWNSTDLHKYAAELEAVKQIRQMYVGNENHKPMSIDEICKHLKAAVLGTVQSYPKNELRMQLASALANIACYFDNY